MFKNIFIKVLFLCYKVKSTFLREIIRNIILKLDGGEMWSANIRKLYLKYHGISIGIGTYGGCFKIGSVPNNTIIGKYCSFAPNINVFNANHPKNYVSTHPILYNPEMGYVQKETIERSQLIIGNDVWIGQNAIILPSVNQIGHGAIIGAGAVVTSNVSPYSIVVGVPARFTGYRFEEEQIDKLLRIRWQDWDKKLIRDNLADFYNCDLFIQKHLDHQGETNAKS